jgi:hypothetical protein
MSINFAHQTDGRKPINSSETYVGFPRASRANNVHEDLRGALRVGCGRGSDVWLVVRYFLAGNSLIKVELSAWESSNEYVCKVHTSHCIVIFYGKCVVYRIPLVVY